VAALETSDLAALEAKGDDVTVTWTTPDGEVHATCHAHPLDCTAAMR
jgi:hypothetical protein